MAACPLAAFGGKRAVMEQLAPLGPVYQAGTLSGNPVATSCGLATLKEISKPGFFDALSARTQSLVDGLKAAGIQQDMGFITKQIGMFSYSGLSKDQMVRLRTEFGVYGTDTGRMCVAALNNHNLPYVCQAIAAVLKS